MVVPVRNYPRHALARTLESLRYQRGGSDDVEICVADYGSSEACARETETTAREWGAFHRVFDERGPWNRARAINLGVRATVAPVIIASDADIVFAPDFLDCLRELAARTGPEWYAHMPMLDLPRGVQLAPERIAEDYHPVASLAEQRVWSKGNVAFTRLLFERLRGWEEAFTVWGCEDNEFFDRCSRSDAPTFDLTGRTSCLHHWHPSNKRGEEARAAIARNQVIYWPNEGRLPVVRSGPLAGEPPLDSHRPFSLPLVSMIVAGREPGLSTAVRLLCEQSYKAVEILRADLDAGRFVVSDGFGTVTREGELPSRIPEDAIAHCRTLATGDLLAAMDDGFRFPNDEHLVWAILIPMLKGERPSRRFTWRCEDRGQGPEATRASP